MDRRSCTACGTLKTCSSCGRNNSHKYFSTIEWDRDDTVRLCRDCLPRECQQCRQTKRREHFRKQQWTRKDGMRTCKACERRRCMICVQEKGKQVFSEENWELPDDASNAACKQCWRQRTVLGLWTCFASDCKIQLPKEKFTLAHQRYNKQQLAKTRYRWCDHCLQLRDEQKKIVQGRNVQQVVKRRKKIHIC